jgi:hypothetical protein
MKSDHNIDSIRNEEDYKGRKSNRSQKLGNITESNLIDEGSPNATARREIEMKQQARKDNSSLIYSNKSPSLNNATNPYSNNLYNYKDQPSKGSNNVVSDEYGVAETSHFNRGELSKMQNTLSPIRDERDDHIFNDPREAHFS